MRFAYLFIALITLSACTNVTNSENGDDHEMKVIKERNEVGTVNSDLESPHKNEIAKSPVFSATHSTELSLQDSEKAYEMCVKGLTDFYKAVRNGTDFEVDTFIENKNLKQYMEYKMQYLSDLHSYYDFDKVQSIDVGEWEVKYTDDENGGFLYYKLPADIKNSTGSHGEVAEMLVRNVNGKLVIVDWYTGTKDGYDFMVRGERLTINNPDIWNNIIEIPKLDFTVD